MALEASAHGEQPQQAHGHGQQASVDLGADGAWRDEQKQQQRWDDGEFAERAQDGYDRHRGVRNKNSPEKEN